MAKLDPQIVAHLEWLGFVQPRGLVVSAPALVRAGALLDRRDAKGQALLRESVDGYSASVEEDGEAVITDFESFARSVLGWSFSPKGYAGTDQAPIPDELEVPLSDYGETLRPDFAVQEPDPDDDQAPWQLLVQTIDTPHHLDKVASGNGGLEASAHGRMERLLRETEVEAGLLVNRRTLRLISAPRGESSGWIDFNVAEMVQTAGRPISTAMRLLLNERRLLALPKAQRLATLLDDSRKFQNEVSERLAEQVLQALYELVRGFQSADDAASGELLGPQLGEDPDEIYRSLLTVILRLVFTLYAEERGMLPDQETFVRFYSLVGLYERLREDAALHTDTMSQRYGAWAQLLTLFRMIHDGAKVGDLEMPERHGGLFDPDRFPFLEGRVEVGARQVHERISPPLVPDATVFRALDKLLVLDGERISYRALDVEQIGSVYETMMGFRLERATGKSAAIKAQKRHGAPTTVNLEVVLAEEPGKRAKLVKDTADRKLSPKVTTAVKDSESLEDLHAALAPVIDSAATPDLVAAGAMILQPSEERRRSGSHYTPRSLTEPIVRTALEPILDQIKGSAGEHPRPDQILDLKVCDPAMGSGAFLVEACRQLGDTLLESWGAHGGRPEIPPDEDEVVFARRLVAQRCLYGVDRNPVAVDLAKMSLWLVTLAREHPLTFVDHALRHGDSLVGMSREQIEAFHWDPSEEIGTETLVVGGQIAEARKLREQIREAGEDVSDEERRRLWDYAQATLSEVRLYGDLLCAAFFLEGRTKDRERRRKQSADKISSGEGEKSYMDPHLATSAIDLRGLVADLRESEYPISPFHWEIEFPEVFDRGTPGFDGFVGNPPFLKGGGISAHLGDNYRDYLLFTHDSAHGNSDLVAYFFRDSFRRLRIDGALGLIATKTIAQGDTRSTGLRWIRQNGGLIYQATTRLSWPGTAAVTVSTVHIQKSDGVARPVLDGHRVDRINAFLLARGGDDDPTRLATNQGLSFEGSKVYGQGFLFADGDPAATPLREMRRLLTEDPRNAERIFPYISGSDLNDNPKQETGRFVIDFRDLALEEAARWPALLAIVESRVRPERAKLKRKALRERWWIHGEHRPGLYAAIRRLGAVLVNSKVSQWLAFAFVPANMVYSHNLNVFATDQCAAFCSLQARSHEVWVRRTASTLEDRLGYRPTDCFETFPFPENWQERKDLEEVGKAYYQFRAGLMVRNDEGLTKSYNRFHDPDERDAEIEKLRELHADMDRAVLTAYGWDDVSTDCEFLLDYEIDEEEWGRKKKPYRYRWPDEVRDEVLGRLIELNDERAEAEKRAGGAPKTKPRPEPSRKAGTEEQTEAMF